MNRLALLFALLFLISCKSTKKIKQTVSEDRQVEILGFQRDSILMQRLSIESVNTLDEVVEEIEERFEVLDSAGTAVIVPVTITRRRTTSQASEHRQEDSTSARVTIDSTRTDSTYRVRIKDLDKASEGAEVLDDLAKTLSPKWGRLLIGILMAVIPVLWGLWKRKQNIE